MFKPISVAIGLRYIRAKRRNGFISFISLASILGIALGVTVLITTLAVMNGFQREIKDRLLQMTAHATISVSGAPLQDWPPVLALAQQDPRILGTAPYVEGQALIQGTSNQPAIVRGIDPVLEQSVSVIGEKMTEGSIDTLAEGEFHILLGKELAAWLGVGRGGTVLVMLPEFQGTPVGAMPRYKRFVVSGLFEVGHGEIDRNLAVVHMADLQRVLRMGDAVTGVTLKVDDMDRAYEIASDLAFKLNDFREYGLYHAMDWTRQNASLYQALKLEKTMLGLLLSLIIVMGSFNLVASQVSLVTDKQADIAILRTLGLSPGGVMGIFMVQGSLIGVIGTVLGVVGGIALTLNLEHVLRFGERLFNAELLPKDVYYITGLPTQLQGLDVLIIVAVALALSFLATLYPAWRAARVHPAEALRYE